jgi:hypothetical protein
MRLVLYRVRGYTILEIGDQVSSTAGNILAVESILSKEDYRAGPVTQNPGGD